MSTLLTRDLLLSRLQMDLVGPYSADEVLTERPSDRYLTGILFPRDSRILPEEDEQLDGAGDDDASSGDVAEEAVPLMAGTKPSSAGLSFMVKSSASGNPPEINVRVSCGTYIGEEEKNEKTGRLRVARWRRSHHEFVVGPIALNFGDGFSEVSLGPYGLPSVKLYVRTVTIDSNVICTAVLINDKDRGEGRVEAELATLFQVQLQVSPAKGTVIIPRPSKRRGNDEDTRSNDLIYRDVHEYAVGHTCSAIWNLDGENSVSDVRIEWIPTAEVQPVSHNGSSEFQALASDSKFRTLSAEWLSRSPKDDLVAGLRLVLKAYEKWIDAQERVRLSKEFELQAGENLGVCRSALSRMNTGLNLLENNAVARKSFQLANAAMELQVKWQKNGSLTWRPFQLAFQLLVVESLANRKSPDRGVMDLLWFPTGGGKTEAYLGLIAFVLFYRRLSQPKDPDKGAGVNVFMRYTLRLLTVQQFQRAAALICACEHLRATAPADLKLGAKRFSIGLWVGQGATPNTVEGAHSAAESAEAAASPKQLKLCPACKESKLRWGIPRNNQSFPVSCLNDSCPFGSQSVSLPIWTVDSDVYNECPSLVIGTIDKFAQIVRKPDAGRLFGVGTGFEPPEMIIQDELHLISGPLGTIAGVYEVAIDALCSRNGYVPKLIGSTATIRRAREQIRSLFNRNSFQFPPPGISASDSGFSVLDSKTTGRRYVGITTAGRSPKYSLQAVCASLLQSMKDSGIDEKHRDDYWTMVTYFNSLRQLGGARVMMLDDVPSTIRSLAMRRSEDERKIAPPEELTSNKKQSEIPEMLEMLKIRCDAGEAVDILLASNMISVGVDIPRLALMVLDGQPKGIAEYIQATSRVGRDAVPGMVFTVYNSSKARDRSRYETFSTWHSSLYREVEATSVTPFASRARDKALHAALVAMARYLVDGLLERPNLTENQKNQCEQLAKAIVQRAGQIDDAERVGVEADLRKLIDEWYSREGMRKYWDDSPQGHSLLMSAEQVAAIKSAEWALRRVWPTPNSMREVEPSTQFVVSDFLKKGPVGGRNEQ